ncbi:MAG: energy transducer TonB [Burkholderiales bacterium]|nr:energy transducer TonB [Burkholderiales bacterium]
MASTSAWRLGLALGLSIAAHGALLVLVEAEPRGTRAASAVALHASLERVAEAASAVTPSEAAMPAAAGNDAERAPVETVSAHKVPRAREDAAPRPNPVTTPAEGSQASPGMALPVTRDPTFYSIAALDSPPRLVGVADLCYPDGANGEVTYTLSIDEAGVVAQASVTDIKPVGLFTAAAEQMCRTLKFIPAVKDGRAVRSRVRFVVGPKSS